ncbi:Bug family tripartite tricarboxylate transporter substrate binding protein [Roseomonas xinghualingensis]|uniref:Bug family tripartite tricarboxylate transporter substrate binding protein n=1 Tax=Roseomonas xinghualingensis TaxID=2986475 RepID=UPI0021F20730|nr:tripartite tricarboxylate transporter substrate binding protein [Roseomonas sp. SXEYE001]MCV4210228.1 tripartite tricarboxylate transporter substrate binding protein [Roseomonas sp. SXEYE001]
MKLLNRRLLLASPMLALPSLGTGAQSASGATGYPSRPVRIIVPFPAGGSNDISARVAAEHLRTLWGQPFVVENLSGAGGNVGTANFARAEPDGYTLLVTPPGPLSINQFLFRDLGFAPEGFVPVTVLCETPNVAIVSTNSGIRTLGELIERARARPETLTYASQGVGTTSHLTAALFQDLTGTKLVHIPYRGEAPAMTDVVGGRVDMIFSNVTGALTQHQAGRVRMLAVADKERAPEVPDVPNAAEAGLPGFQSTAWFAAVAPASTPAPVVARLYEGLSQVLRSPSVQRRYRELGAAVVGGTPAETAAFVAAERTRWGALVQRANVTVE